MDVNRFIRRIARTHPAQGITIRFMEDGIPGLARLYAQARNNSATRLNDSDMLTAAAILSSNSWGGSHNRSVTFFGLRWVANDLLAQVAKDVESIDVGDHGAKGLMTSREKKRDEAVASIVKEVLTPDLVAEVKGWDLNIEGQLAWLDEAPGIQFFLTRTGGEIVTNVFLDGWSGRMAVGWRFGDELYIRPEQLQQLIRKTVEAKLEELTAAA